MKDIGYLVVFAVFFAACSSPVTVISSWKNKEELKNDNPKYKKVFISAITGNEQAKLAVEGELAKVAEKKGIDVVIGSDLFASQSSKDDAPDKEAVLKKIRDKGCGAIFTVTLVNKDSETRFVPGTVTYAPYPVRPYYGTYWGYQSYWYGSSMFTSPGYYDTDKTYFIEGNLYDAKSEKILWSSQSETVNPSNIKSFSEKYASAILARMQSDGLIKK